MSQSVKLDLKVHALGAKPSTNESPYNHIEVQSDNKTIKLKVPQKLKKYGFKETSLTTTSCDYLYTPYSTSQIYKLCDCAKQQIQSNSNLLVLSYGARSSEKRQLLFQEKGLVELFLVDMLKECTGMNMQATACLVNYQRELLDLVDPQNVITATDRHNTQTTTNATQFCISSSDTVTKLLTTIRKSIESIDSKSTDYSPRSIAFNLLVSNKSNKLISDVWFVELADCERPSYLSTSQQLQAYGNTHRELSAFTSVISAITSHRLKIPFQKSRIGNLMRNCLTQSNCLVHALLHLQPKEEDQIGEDASILQLFNRVSGGGIGVTKTRDTAADIFTVETHNNRIEAELAVASKVYPTLLTSVKFKDSQSYIDQGDAYISKVLESYTSKLEKERQKITEEAKQQAETYLIQKISEWKQDVMSFEKQAKIVEKEINSIPEKDSSIESESKQKLSVIKDASDGLQKQLMDITDQIKVVTDESSLMQDYISQFEAKLAMFSESIEQDREQVEEQRNKTRNEWTTKSAQYEKDQAEWLKTYSDQMDTIRRHLRTLPVDESDKVISQCSSSNEFEITIAHFINGDKEVESSEEIAHLFNECDIRKTTIEVARLQMKQKAELVEKEIADIVKQSEVLKQQTEHRKQEAALEKIRELQSWKTRIEDQVRKGTVLLKVPDNGKPKKRYFWISFDKICSCELSDNGLANKEKVTKSVPIKHIKQIILGQHTERFKSYLKKAATSPMSKDPAAKSILGRFNKATNSPQTPPVRRTFLGRQKSGSFGSESNLNMPLDYYLSFSLVIKKNKTMDLYAEDKDTFESWIVGLTSVLGLEPMYGETLDMPSLIRLNDNKEMTDMSQEEFDLCARLHLSPMIFRSIRTNVFKRRETEMLTALDIRNMTTINLMQAETIYAFAQSRSWIAKGKVKTAFSEQ